MLTLGSIVGGALLGGILAAASLLARTAPTVRSGTALAVAVAASLGLLVPGVVRWLPDRECQVRKYFMYSVGHTKAAFRWGIELGLAVCTFFVTPALLSLLVLGAAQSSPVGSLLVGGVYGTTRGVSMLLFTILVAKGRFPSPEPLAERVVLGTRLPILAAMLIATALVVFGG